MASETETDPLGEVRRHGDPTQAVDPQEITILFGSQTGSAAWLAAEYCRRLQSQGFQVARRCMSEYRGDELKEVKNLLVLISTHLNGSPPDTAVAFCEFLLGGQAPQLPDLRFSVLALGDITYEEYCTVGKQLDRRLEELGAQRLHPRVDCDVDFEETAETWLDGVIHALGGHCAVSPIHPTPAPVAINTAPATREPCVTRPSYSRENLFQAEVLENRSLTGPESDGEVRHLRLSIAGSGLRFEPGDSLGIYPRNHPQLVEELLDALGYGGKERVAMGSEECSMQEALSSHCEITVLPRPLLEGLARFAHGRLNDLLQDQRRDELAALIDGRDLLDLVREFSLAGIPAQELVSLLRRLPARLYSIATSRKVNPDEVQLAVAVVRYRRGGRNRYGVCSVQCAERAEPGDRLPVYVNSNPYFRLPSDPDASIIMVGPGVGVAPFRAFLQEREQTGAGGRNWLLFGARRRRTDFLYESDWRRWQSQGVLTRMDVTFSRDTQQKMYVQHRMMEHGKQLVSWLEAGAYLYVCGDQKRMAPHVHVALLKIVERETGLDRDRAAAFVTTLQRERRYQRDVY